MINRWGSQFPLEPSVSFALCSETDHCIETISLYVVTVDASTQPQMEANHAHP